MDKAEIIAALKEMALLLTIDGANAFKVRAFENGARALETADIVGAVLYLASDHSKLTTGQTIMVDGGTVFL